MNALLPSLKLTRTYTAHTPRAKQTIFVFTPQGPKMSGAFKNSDRSGKKTIPKREKKMLFISFVLFCFLR